LFMPSVLTNNSNYSLAFNYLAFSTNFFYGCPDFHYFNTPFHSDLNNWLYWKKFGHLV